MASDLFVSRAGQGDVSEVLRRLKFGQDINAKHTSLGHTALHAAVDGGHMPAIVALLDAGADVNAQRLRTLDTPLHTAVTASVSVEVVKALLARGASPAKTNVRGETPLDVALEYRKIEVVRLLGGLPAAPTGIHMDQCGAVSALITWQPITAGIVVDCYEVEVECESHSKSPVKGGSGAGKTTRTYIRRQNYALVRGLLPGKGFQVRVRAHNVCGWGPPSPIASFLTNGYVPTPPRRVRALTNVGTQVRVSWDSADGCGSAITEYVVQYMTRPATRSDSALTVSAPSSEVSPLWDEYGSLLSDACARFEPPLSCDGDDVIPYDESKATRGGLTETGLNPWLVLGSGAAPGLKDACTKPPRRSHGTTVSSKGRLSHPMVGKVAGGSSNLAFESASGGSLVLKVGAPRRVKSAAEGSSTREEDTENYRPTCSPIQVSIPRLVTCASREDGTMSPVDLESHTGRQNVVFPTPVCPSMDGPWSCTQVVVPASETRYTITTPGPEYFVQFRVIARNAVGYGQPSEFRQFFVPDAPIVTEATASTMTVTFGKYRATDLERRFQSFEVQVQVLAPDVAGGHVVSDSAPRCPQPPSADDGSEWKAVGHDGLPPPVVVKGLLPGTRYRFRYRIGSPTSTGTQWPDWACSCPSVWFTTLADTPDAPQSLKCHARDAVTAVLSWQRPRPNGAPISTACIEYQEPKLGKAWHTAVATLSKRSQIGSGRTDVRDNDVNVVDVWEISKLKPGHTYCFRVSLSNSCGFSSFSPPSGSCTTESIVPDTPDAPLCDTAGPDSVIVTVHFPYSSGIPIVGMKLYHKKIRSGRHPAEHSESDDDDVTVVRTSQESGDAPLVEDGSDTAAKRHKSKPEDQVLQEWGRPVNLPTNMTYSSTTGSARTTVTPKHAGNAVPIRKNKVPARTLLSWGHVVADDGSNAIVGVKLVLGGFYAGSVHKFRVQVANAIGWSSLSPVSTPVATLCQRPFTPAKPRVNVVSPTDVVVVWKQPHSCGAFIQHYVLQCLKLGRCTSVLNAQRQRAVDVTVPLPNYTASDSSGDEAVDEVAVPGVSGNDVGKPVWENVCDCVDPLLARDSHRGFNDVEVSASRPTRRLSSVIATLHDSDEDEGKVKAIVARHDGYGNELAWTVSGLEAAMQYQFRVVAVNRIGPSTSSTASDVVRTLSTVPQRSPTPLLCPQSHSTAGLVVSLPACCGSRLSHLEIQIATSTDNGRLALANCPIDELVWVPPPSVVIDGTSAQSSTCVELGRHFWPSQSKLPLPTLRHLLSRRPYMECTVQGLPAGASFIARMRFKNRRGWGEFSDVTPVCNLPSAHANTTAPPVAVMKNHNAVVVGWRRSLIHSDASIITAFKLQYKRVRRERGVPNSSDTEPDSDVEEDGVDPWLLPPVCDDGLIPLDTAHGLCVPQSKHLFESGECDPMRMASRLAPAEAPRVPVTETSAIDFAWIVGGLLPGAQYMFRLAVVTATGCSEFLTTTHPVVTESWTPQSPTQPLIDNGGKETIVITSETPKCNGATVTKYQAQSRFSASGVDANEGKWTLVADVISEECTLPHSASGASTGQRGSVVNIHVPSTLMQRGGNYVFRIRAGNREGWSPWSQQSLPFCVAAVVPDKLPSRPIVCAVSKTSHVLAWIHNGLPDASFAVEGRQLFPVVDGLSPVVGVKTLKVGDVDMLCTMGDWRLLTTVPASVSKRLPPPLSATGRHSDDWTLVGGHVHKPEHHYAVVDGLSAGQTMQYRVAAVNGVGTGPWSDITVPVSCTIDVVRPPPPSTPLLSCPRNEPIRLSWTCVGVMHPSQFAVEVTDMSLDEGKRGWSRIATSIVDEGAGRYACSTGLGSARLAPPPRPANATQAHPTSLQKGVGTSTRTLDTAAASAKQHSSFRVVVSVDGNVSVSEPSQPMWTIPFQHIPAFPAPVTKPRSPVVQIPAESAVMAGFEPKISPIAVAAASMKLRRPVSASNMEGDTDDDVSDDSSDDEDRPVRRRG